MEINHIHINKCMTCNRLLGLSCCPNEDGKDNCNIFKSDTKLHVQSNYGEESKCHWSNIKSTMVNMKK